MQSLVFKRNPFLGLNRLKWGSIHPKRPTHSGRQIMLVEPFYPDLSLALSQQPCSPQAAFMNVMSLWKLLKTYPYFSTKFVVGTFCSCTVKWEHTRQCASDLDLFCFKHIPPSIEPADCSETSMLWMNPCQHVHESEGELCDESSAETVILKSVLSSAILCMH